MPKVLLVVFASLAAAITYARVATFYHLPFPPNWLGRIVGADGEYSYDMANLSLIIDVQILWFTVWGYIEPLSGHETLDGAGAIRRVRPEIGGPKIHYGFDVDGRYIGKW